ncbi:MAG: response regulator [Anaerolineae bacterium]
MLPISTNARILFVDDEPRILRGLRRQLSEVNNNWDLLFAESGPDALDLLGQHPCDAIVTDMRMPGMDGAELLKEVWNRHPQVIRFVLSGQTDKEALLRTAGLAHQFLSKPCDINLLQEALSNALALQGVLASNRLQKVTLQLKTLPSLPTLFTELLREIQSPNASVKHIGQIIAQDIGMTAKILQLVNSAFFGLRQHISDPTQAVIMLGLDTVKTLVLSAHVFAKFNGAQLGKLSFDQLQEHSLFVAMLAKRITEAEQVQRSVIDFAFTAGLLHDLGRLILAANLPDDYSQVLAVTDQLNGDLLGAESQVFGATHPEVGAYLLAIWGLPQPVVEAVTFHHQPTHSLDKSFTPTTAVHVANVLTHEVSHLEASGAPPQFDTSYLNELHYLEHLPNWRELCLAMFQKANRL